MLTQIPEGYGDVVLKHGSEFWRLIANTMPLQKVLNCAEIGISAVRGRSFMNERVRNRALHVVAFPFDLDLGGRPDLNRCFFDFKVGRFDTVMFFGGEAVLFQDAITLNDQPVEV